MARLPRVFDITYQVEDELRDKPALRMLLQSMREWAQDMVDNQQRYNVTLLNDYQARRNPPECPAALSSQLNTTNPLYKPGAGKLIYVSDASGGAEIGFGDESTWRLVRTKGAV